MRIIKQVSLEDPLQFKEKLLAWAQQYPELIFLESNNNEQKNYDTVLALEASTHIKCHWKDGFKTLQNYQKTTKDWLFGYLSYDLKNTTEILSSSNFDGLNFPDLYFFQPKKLFLIKGDCLEMHYLKGTEDEMETDLLSIKNTIINNDKHNYLPIKLKPRTSKASYFSKLKKIQNHINKGDIYEVNFCQEFYATEVRISPYHTYKKLNAISQGPFAVFFKINDYYAISASPERYLKKDGSKVISQPIKGTSKRSENPDEDRHFSKVLLNSEKERSENIMIVDLVRNDLSRTAIKGSVKVEALCELHSFKQVHQLISTISSRVQEDINPVEILKTTFPMGSMTGVPKIRAMKIIEDVEDFKRGLYSGSIGYFSPHNDFDFNVVIRSILYNKKTKYVSCATGGAITANSIIEDEYQECLIKADAMKKVLGGEL